jgi:hypothetical protein
VAHYPELQSIRIDGLESDSITALDIDQQMHERPHLIRRRTPGVPGR